jgi:hypothetical protein
VHIKITTTVVVISSVVGNGSGTSTLKKMVSETPMFPASSFAKIVRLWSPSANPVKVVFPKMTRFSFPSRLCAICEVGSFTVKFNGTSEMSYVLFTGDKTETLEEVTLMVKLTKPEESEIGAFESFHAGVSPGANHPT